MEGKQSKTPINPQNTEQKQLLSLMFEMGRMLKREAYHEKSDIPSFLHAETLRYIKDLSEKGANPTMSDIAEYLRIAPPSATALVNSLVKDDILERVPDQVDRRVVRLVLSKKGVEALENTMHLREEAVSRVIAHLSSSERKELIRLLSIITQKQ